MPASYLTIEELARTLAEELGARRLVAGDSSRSVRGLAPEEPGDGWIEPDEVAISTRESLDGEFLEYLRGAGSVGLIWRADSEPEAEVVERARELGLCLLAVPAKVPLRRLLSLVGGDDALMLRSHAAAKTLLEGMGGESSVGGLASRVSGLLGRSFAVEDAVGRLVASESADDAEGIAGVLEKHELRASRNSGVEETRKERRDRYARLSDGFLSVPVERWRVAEREVFWTPIGEGAPAGYLWFEPGEPLGPEEVVTLHWSRKALETELGKERIRLETELGVRGDFVDDLVGDHHGSVGILLQRALYLGANLSDGALVVIVDIDDFARYLERRKPKEPAIQELKRRLSDAVRLQTRELFSNFLIGPRSDNVILLLAPAEGESPEEVAEKALTLASRIQRYVKGLLTELTVSIGVGRFKGDPADLSGAYSEAQVALEIGHRIHGPSSVSTFEGTGTYKLLFRVMREDPRELETFYRETVEPAVRYDSRYGTELVNTLLTYLENDASTVRTASLLYAHRHTIRYRLDRVRELTGLDVEKSEARERLTLGIKAMQLLGRAPGSPARFSDK